MTVRRRWVWRRGGDEADTSEVLVEAGDGGEVKVSRDGERTGVDCAVLPDGRASVILRSGRQISGRATLGANGRVETWVGGLRRRLELADPLSDLAAHAEGAAEGSAVVTAPIPGRVVEVRVSEGDVVTPGTTLIVLEAMKMQNEIRAESRARVERVECRAGEAVETGTVLVHLDSEGLD